MLVTMFDLIILNPEEERLLDSWVLAAFPLVKDVESKEQKHILFNFEFLRLANVCSRASWE